MSWAPSSLPEADDDTVERLMRMYQDDEALGMALSDAEALGIAQSDLGHSVFPESVMIPMMMGLIKA